MYKKEPIPFGTGSFVLSAAGFLCIFQQGPGFLTGGVVCHRPGAYLTGVETGGDICHHHRVKSRQAFRKADESGDYAGGDATLAMLQALQNGDLSAVAAGLQNDFERLIPLEEVQAIREKMLANGALGARMTGLPGGAGCAEFAGIVKENI